MAMIVSSQPRLNLSTSGCCQALWTLRTCTEVQPNAVAHAPQIGQNIKGAWIKVRGKQAASKDDLETQELLVTTA